MKTCNLYTGEHIKFEYLMSFVPSEQTKGQNKKKGISTDGDNNEDDLKYSGQTMYNEAKKVIKKWCKGIARQWIFFKRGNKESSWYLP